MAVDNYPDRVTCVKAGYDRTASYRKGAAHAPGKVLNAFRQQVELFDRFTGLRRKEFPTFVEENIDHLNEMPPAEMVDAVQKKYADTIGEHDFPLLVGGEHSVSLGLLRFLATRIDPTSVTIVHIDAHLDLRDTDADYNKEDPSNLAHSCVMRRAFELGFNILNIGARSFSKEEYDFARGNDIKYFEWGRSEVPSIEKILANVSTENVYISIDVDGIDPAHMPGTGTPVPGGLEWYYTRKLISEMFSGKHVIGADIVEVAPQNDSVVTEFAAAQLISDILASITTNKSNL